VDDFPAIFRLVHKHNQQKKLRIGITDCVIPYVTTVVFTIVNDDYVRVKEYLFGRFKADVMFREIAFGFLRTPGELNLHTLL
jgi:hypothetical protein